ncbi:MAG: MBL fold metallo-hydrolase [Sideroxydans sp.]|nr:MBL fold metallo-hydrolase [Sideroxydans sp.]
MRFAFLGSGSEGNSLLVQAADTTLMLDCGFSVNETVSRLARLGMQAEQLNGILVTHEHSDHIGGVARLARKFKLPVWMTHGTLLTQQAAFADIAVTELNPHHCIVIGDIEVQPFLVPHDAREPVQYVFSDGRRRLGVLTDTGHITPHIEESLAGCHAMVLECNHDEEMLRTGRYPPSLKQRVGGRFGHLSNRQAAGLLASMDISALKCIVAAHLSKQNNQPELAAQALSEVLSCKLDEITIASQSDGVDWISID